jgi:tetratricopeptide (TPR) repeat protein
MAWVLRYLAYVWQTPWQTRELYRKALAIFEETGDEQGIIGTLYRLGWIASQIGDYQEAQELVQESLNRARRLGGRELTMICLVELGYIHWALGNYQEAEEACQQSISISREIGYHSQIAMAFRHLARIAVSLGNYLAAKKHLQESIGIYEEIGLLGMKAESLGELAHIAVLERDFAVARQQAQESLTLCEEREHAAGMIEPMTIFGEVASGLGDFREAERHFHHALQISIEVCAPAYALHTLAGLAQLLAALNEKAWAYDVVTFVLQQPASWQWSRDCLKPLAAELGTELPPEVVVEAQNRARDKTLEGMIEELVKTPQSQQAPP